MESAQKDLLSVLLEHVYSLGLISKVTYLQAADLVHSATDLPEFFQRSVCLTKEDSQNECAQNAQ